MGIGGGTRIGLRRVFFSSVPLLDETLMYISSEHICWGMEIEGWTCIGCIGLRSCCFFLVDKALMCSVVRIYNSWGVGVGDGTHRTKEFFSYDPLLYSSQNKFCWGWGGVGVGDWTRIWIKEFLSCLPLLVETLVINNYLFSAGQCCLSREKQPQP